MPNPLATPAPSPLLQTLIQRHVGGGNLGQTPKLPTSNLNPTLPKLRAPNLRPRRFAQPHLRTELQPKRMI